jgi:hypothetical protein
MRPRKRDGDEQGRNERDEAEGPEAERLRHAAARGRPGEVADRPDLRPDDHGDDDALDADGLEQGSQRPRLTRADADADEDGDPATSTTAPSPAEPAPTTTVAPASTTSTTVAPPLGAAAPCPDLRSETFWVETGDRSQLRAAAGAAATYVEVVTNRSDRPCQVEANRCGTTAQLRTADGAPTDAPAMGCAAYSEQVILRPGEARREELQVRFPVPPGDYHAHVRGYDGVEVVLPVRLDGRLPACDPSDLEITNGGGEQLVERDDARERGFDLQLVVSGAGDGCTVRVAETTFQLTGDDQVIELVDATERWSAPTDGDRVLTHAVAPPTDLAPAWYDVEVTVELAGGSELSAPFRILVV